jgi:hypothetical protein
MESQPSFAQLHVETVIIRLGRVPFMDATGMHTFREILEHAGITRLVGPVNLFDDISAALQSVTPRHR